MASKRIHLIERDGRIEKIDGGIWESGYWIVSSASAKQLVGGSIFHHKKQAEPSFFGGIILGYRIQEEGPFAGRVIFKFQYAHDHRGVSAGKGGWGNEMKMVLPYK